MSNKRSAPELEADFVAVGRLAADAGSPSTALTSLLHIGDQDLVLLEGRGEKTENVRRLNLGATRLATDCFRHDPPTSQEIERAIDVTEDAIMRLGKPSGVSTSPFSTTPALRPWAALSGPTMTIEVVEQWFQRLASASLGQPAAMQGLPPGREAAATLLLLREFLHHHGHASLVFVDPEQPLVNPSGSA